VCSCTDCVVSAWSKGGVNPCHHQKWLCENIQSGKYQEASAPLELWAGGIQHIAQHAPDSHIDAEFPKLAARLFQTAMAAGYGREEVSALFKVLQMSS
jgi:3-hydroxyisobutyrate dehydrogenase-like beta-hydroxyacid dehydrogenase